MGFLTYQAECKLLEFLNEELPKVQEKYRTINAGGCGVFAQFLSEELTKLGIDHQIVWIGRHWYTKDKRKIKSLFRRVIKTNEGNLSLKYFHEEELSLAHLMVEVGNHLVDATGVYADLEDTCWEHLNIIGTLTLKQVTEMVSTPSGWNDEFDREHIKGVGSMVKKITKKIPKVLEI